MLDKIERHLLVINTAVFVGVLSILAIAVFAYFKQSLDHQIKVELNKLADSVISSIDFDEVGGRHDAGVPDAIVGALPLKTSESLSQTRLQWFDKAGHLSANRGQFPVNVQFSGASEFQEQKAPHALLLTRPALMNEKLLGYVRVVHPLQATDEVLQRLLTGLIIGIASSAAVSALAIRWLVRQSMAPVLTMVRSLKQFTADASHELGSPLMVIKSNSQVALKYPDGMRDSDMEKFKAIRDAAEQMSQLTAALLVVAKLEDASTDFELTASTVNLSELCQALVQKESEIHGNLISVSTQLPELLPIRAERADLERLFGNVIGNAFQYTPPGGSISITGRIEETTVIVTVKDTGIGIEPADQPHVFDRFWRADRARNHRDHGSGLGLAIAKAIADRYRGTIFVESQLGSGSKFSIHLPVDKSVTGTISAPTAQSQQPPCATG